MSSLFVIQGRDQGKRFELDAASMFIGRDPTCQIRLTDTEVSRRHAELRRTTDGEQWVDLGSSNGTFINSVRAEQHALRSGDRIQVGRTLMVYTATVSRSTAPKEEQGVDIVGVEATFRDSRIVRSVSQEEGSQLLSRIESGAGADSDGGPWRARARSNLQIMYHTALAVSHTLDIDQLLQRILELIFDWVAADRGCIMLVDQETDELVPRARRDRKPTDQAGRGAVEIKQEGIDGPGTPAGAADQAGRLQISRTILDYVREKQEGVLTSDAREDERWDPAASIVRMGVREAICVPMKGRYGIVGAIYIDTFVSPGQSLREPGEAKRFRDEHLKLMVAIGHQAALAVEDTSYYSAMVQAERLAAMGQAIAGLSHHIKNILQGIRGGSYLVDEGLKAQDWEVTRKGWGIVEKNQDRISALVMDMLTFSKERQPEMVNSDINEVVGDVLELMATRATENEVDLVDGRTAGIPRLTFDPDGMHRAILNVVTNAIDACAAAADQTPCDDETVESGTGGEALGRGARVEVRTELNKAAGKLVIEVIDNGEGIPEAEQSKIFNVFESSKGQRGTGLGLSVTQKIVQEHGGEVELLSEAGQGAAFRLILPVNYSPASVTQAIPNQPSGS